MEVDLILGRLHVFEVALNQDFLCGNVQQSGVVDTKFVLQALDVIHTGINYFKLKQKTLKVTKVNKETFEFLTSEIGFVKGAISGMSDFSTKSSLCKRKSGLVKSLAILAWDPIWSGICSGVLFLEAVLESILSIF